MIKKRPICGTCYFVEIPKNYKGFPTKGHCYGLPVVIGRGRAMVNLENKACALYRTKKETNEGENNNG